MSAYCDFIADYFRQGGTISFKPFDAQMKFFYVTKPCEFSAIYKRAPYNTLVLSECPPEADYAEFIYDMNNPMAGPEPRINFYIYKELRARGVEIPWAKSFMGDSFLTIGLIIQDVMPFNSMDIADDIIENYTKTLSLQEMREMIAEGERQLEADKKDATYTLRQKEHTMPRARFLQAIEAKENEVKAGYAIAIQLHEAAKFKMEVVRARIQEMKSFKPF